MLEKIQKKKCGTSGTPSSSKNGVAAEKNLGMFEVAPKTEAIESDIAINIWLVKP